MATAVSKPFKSLGGFDAGSGNINVATDNYLYFGGTSGLSIRHTSTLASITETSTNLELRAVAGDLLLLANQTSAKAVKMYSTSIEMYNFGSYITAKFDGTNNKSYATTHTLRNAVDSASFLTVTSTGAVINTGDFTVTNGDVFLASGRSFYSGPAATGLDMFHNGTTGYVVARSGNLSLNSVLGGIDLVCQASGQAFNFSIGGTAYAVLNSTALTLNGIGLVTDSITSSATFKRPYLATRTSTAEVSMFFYLPATYSGFTAKITVTTGTGATSKTQYSEVLVTNNNNGASSVATITESNYVDTAGNLCVFSVDVDTSTTSNVSFLITPQQADSTVIRAEVTYFIR